MIIFLFLKSQICIPVFPSVFFFHRLGSKELKRVCEVLDLEKSGNLPIVVERIMEFCKEPKDTGKKLPTPKRKPRSKKEKTATE